MTDDPLVSSLLAAVTANPDDVPLRLHVAELLLDRGRAADAVEQCGAVLHRQPVNADAVALLARATRLLAGGSPVAADGPGERGAGSGAGGQDGPRGGDGKPGGASAGPVFRAPLPPGEPRPEGPRPDEPRSDRPRGGPPAGPGRRPSGGQGSPPTRPVPPTSTGPPGPSGSPSDFDWSAAEEQVSDIAPPLFVSDDGNARPAADDEVETSSVRLADVGGMEAVKQRLEVAFLGPMRNPELAKMYGKSLAGGLLLYGPPGCGKTFVARAVAGELGARFYAVSLADVIDHYFGDTEKNIRSIFDTARRNAPCVLFFDEVDAIGHRRSRIGSGWSGMRMAVNQLLHEMDSATGSNDGVFVLAATNHPWDVDPALRRPGRLDRTLLVLPPDPTARAAILRFHLRQRPLAGLDPAALVRRTDDFSGADVAHLCDTAAENALQDSVRSGSVRPIGMADFEVALRQVRPSTGPWFETARNVAMFANGSGEYDELLAYLKAKKLA